MAAVGGGEINEWEMGFREIGVDVEAARQVGFAVECKDSTCFVSHADDG